MKKLLKGIGVFFAALLSIVLIVALVPTLSKEEDKLGTYENVMGENISNPLVQVTEVAMLGAHDAFTSGISYESNSNVNEDGIFNNKLVTTIGKGLVIKMAKAQVASAKQMLYKGVRYFDVRISKIDDKYYTTHGLLSYELDSYVEDIVDFLSTHPKEFIVFDIQEFYTENGSDNGLSETNDFQELFTHLEDLGLFEYVKNITNISPSLLTYAQVTTLGSKAGCVILAKTHCDNRVYYRDGNASQDDQACTSIRSYWHNKNSKKEMQEGIAKENEYIENSDGLYDNVFRVNQAQMTGFITQPLPIVRFLFHWSLLGLANSWNSTLINDEVAFKATLPNMPIVMVDYATTSSGNFNKLVNTYINDYNRTL